MDHRKLVYPEFLNDHGTLFGGYMLKWIDEFAYITVNLDFPGNKFVTIGLDNVVFKHAVHHGEILRFAVNQKRVGTTSVEYAVEVYGEKGAGQKDKILFQTNITFVNVSDDGLKEPIKLD